MPIKNILLVHLTPKSMYSSSASELGFCLGVLNAVDLLPVGDMDGGKIAKLLIRPFSPLA